MISGRAVPRKPLFWSKQVLMRTHGRRATTIAPAPCIVLRSQQTLLTSAETDQTRQTLWFTSVRMRRAWSVTLWFTPVLVGRVYIHYVKTKPYSLPQFE